MNKGVELSVTSVEGGSPCEGIGQLQLGAGGNGVKLNISVRGSSSGLLLGKASGGSSDPAPFKVTRFEQTCRYCYKPLWRPSGVGVSGSDVQEFDASVINRNTMPWGIFDHRVKCRSCGSSNGVSAGDMVTIIEIMPGARWFNGKKTELIVGIVLWGIFWRSKGAGLWE